MEFASRFGRRAFLKFCATAASLLALPPGAARLLAEGLEKGKRLPMVWLSFQECTGCTESLTRSSAPSIERLLFRIISQDYHHTLQATALPDQCTQRKGECCRAALSSFEALDADRDDRIGESELLDALGRRYRGGLGPWGGPPPKLQEVTP